MLQVNLIGKKRKERSKKNWIVILIMTIFVSFVLYFLGTSGYVIYRLFSLNAQIKQVDADAVEISRVITANKETLSKFVLSKYILDRIEILKRDRFRYKDYLDEVAKFMPPGSVLTNVDFATKGWVEVSASLPNTNALKEFENNFLSTDRLAQSEFGSVFSESVVSDKNGLYNVKLHFEIKTNGRK